MHSFSGSFFAMRVCLVDGFPVMVTTSTYMILANTETLPLKCSGTYGLRILVSAYIYACLCRCLKGPPWV